MKLLSLALASALVMVGSVSMADTGDSADRNGILAVAGSRSNGKISQGPASYGGQTASTETYCTDRPERCSAAPHGRVRPLKLKVQLVSDASGCSNAGDQVARPVYSTIDGNLVFVGYECVQDNRGGNGG